ncbi:hypothetical protein C4J81_07050 [Deltaproteobacteria bacterium Smac51]|nr:hypothetical protein C4J81_07050 [Deltaproteobacteria bacterium Smac51]
MKKIQLFIFLILTLCGPAAAVAAYQNYRDFPGVTEADIEAVEAIKNRYDKLLYAAVPSTEAFASEDGTLVGFTPLFCQWVSDMFGIPVEPVLYETLPELIEALESSSVHLTGELQRTPNRLARYKMTPAIIERKTTIIRTYSAEPLDYIARTRPIRLAMARRSNFSEQMQFVYNLPFESIELDDKSSAVHLLRGGRIDGFITGAHLAPYFEKFSDLTIEPFFPKLYYQTSLSTASADLEPIINIIGKYLASEEADDIAALYSKGEADHRRARFKTVLNDEEKAWLNTRLTSGEAIPFASEFDNYPLSFFNTRTKRWEGIAHDLLAEISALTGLKFQPANTPELKWDGCVEMLDKGEALFITEMMKTSERQGRYLWPDKPYSLDNYALISLGDKKNLTLGEVRYQRVGMTEGSAYAQLFFKWFPDHKHVRLFTHESAVTEALKKGEVDVHMTALSRLLYLNNYLEDPRYKANFVFDRKCDSFLGFNVNEPVLTAIISKAQNLIDLEVISAQWTRRVFDYRSRLAKDTQPYLIATVIILLTGLSLIWVMFMKNRKLNLNLGRLVKERTRELEIQTEAAEVASRSKSEFLANISHEIRTPMNGVIGLNHVMLQTELTSQQRDYIVKSNTAAKSLLRLIDDVLDFSKIEAGHMDMVKGHFRLSDVLESVTDLALGQVAEKELELILTVPPNLTDDLIGDDLRLCQILNNLVSNAVKFTETGEISLTVQLEKEADHEIWLKFMVRDTGIGLEPEQISHIFAAFTQADTSSTRRFGGTGLGLAIVKRLVEMMGGRLWCESEPGQGSLFAFTARFGMGETSLKYFDPPKIYEGRKALVVDGNSRSRTNLAACLELLGVEVERAATDEEACDILLRMKADGSGVDIIFIACQWGRTGTAILVTRLGKIVGENYPALVITGPARRCKEILPRLEKAGFDAHVMPKPVRPKPLTKTLAAAFGGEYSPKKIDPAAPEDQSGLVRHLAGSEILLVEDNDLNQLVAKKLLTKAGFVVEVANNGREAVDKVLSNKYDLVLMDIQMPEMDGLTAAMKIREHPGLKALPIVAMTAHALEEDRRKSLDAGMNEHISKPFDLKELFLCLARFIKKDVAHQN